MTKEQLLHKAREGNPSLLNVSDDDAFALIKQKYPDIEDKISNPMYKPIPFGDSNINTSIWDSMPNALKKGYNNSLQGMAHEIRTGNKRFDLSGYEPSVIGDLGASIASFFMPLDLIIALRSASLTI